jgi:hypothetical protein
MDVAVWYKTSVTLIWAFFLSLYNLINNIYFTVVSNKFLFKIGNYFYQEIQLNLQPGWVEEMEILFSHNVPIANTWERKLFVKFGTI